MALSSSIPSDWTQNMGKRGTIFDFINSRCRIFPVTVTVGNTDTYSTGGKAIDLKKGLISNVYFAWLVSSDYHGDVFYDVANGKVKLFDYNSELANNSVDHRGHKFTFLVIGR